MTSNTIETTTTTNAHEFTENHVNYLLKTFNGYQGSDEEKLRHFISLVQKETLTKLDRKPVMEQAADFLELKKHGKVMRRLAESIQHARNTVRKFSIEDVPENLRLFHGYNHISVTDFQLVDSAEPLTPQSVIRLTLLKHKSWSNAETYHYLNVPATWLYGDPIAVSQTARKQIRQAQQSKRKDELAAAHTEVKKQKDQLAAITAALKESKSKLELKQNAVNKHANKR
jgi:phage-related protein